MCRKKTLNFMHGYINKYNVSVWLFLNIKKMYAAALTKLFN